MTKVLRLLAATLILLTFSGCYYMHLGYGQMKLLWGAVPVKDAVQDGPLSPEERDRLTLVARIKKFAEEELGLKSTGSYETVYLKSRLNPIYTVSASPKDRLSRKTWWFPVVGDMPYIGFFNLESANKKKSELEAQGLDVIVSRANAYSTLGWFNDPVTLNLLDAGTAEFTEIIIHEMTHTTLYVKGQGEFNESLATLVGLIGASQFFDETYGPSHPLSVEAGDAIEEERKFSAFLDSLLLKMERLYDSPLSYEEKLSRREELFSGAVEEFGKLKLHRYAGFGSSGVNNAYLMALALYHRRFPLFDHFLKEQKGSIRNMLAALGKMSSAEGDMINKLQIQNGGF